MPKENVFIERGSKYFPDTYKNLFNAPGMVRRFLPRPFIASDATSAGFIGLRGKPVKSKSVDSRVSVKPGAAVTTSMLWSGDVINDA